jgi:hypothetical protein
MDRYSMRGKVGGEVASNSMKYNFTFPKASTYLPGRKVAASCERPLPERVKSC